MAIAEPTLNNIIKGLRDRLADDLTDAGGEIPTAIAPYGVVWNSALVPRNPKNPDPSKTEYAHLKIGKRQIIPPGLTFFLFTKPTDNDYAYSGEGSVSKININVQIFWDDPQNGPNLTEDAEQIDFFLNDLAQATALAIGPHALGAASGGWAVPNAGGAMVHLPKVETVVPNGLYAMQQAVHGQAIHFCHLVWTATKWFGPM